MRVHFADEPHLIYALDIIVDSIEHFFNKNMYKQRALPFDIALFAMDFSHKISIPKGQRDAAMKELLLSERARFAIPVFSERIRNAPVNQSEGGLLQSLEDIEGETQPRTHHG